MSPTTVPVPARPGEAVDRDQLLPFRGTILGIRAAAAVTAIGLAAPEFAEANVAVMFTCIAAVAYSALRIIYPVRFYDHDVRSHIRLAFGITFHVIAVLLTGFWASPFVFLLSASLIVVSFARGFTVAVRVALGIAVLVGVPYLLTNRPIDQELVRSTTQWTLWLLLIALVAGYGRRVVGETSRQHTLALDRLGRLTDANNLLYSLHQVAQKLPASLDIEESLTNTSDRLQDLFDADAIVVLLLDETDETWIVRRRVGGRPRPTFSTHELPHGLQQALSSDHPVAVDDLSEDRPGLVHDMTSGLYAALRGRDSVVGLVALEALGRGFTNRDQELLDGFMEPAALAIDNARWFSRLRTVGADEERTRIARELHDRIGQSLAYMAFSLDRIIKVDERGEPVTEDLTSLRNDVRTVVSEVRETLYDLRTEVTDEQSPSSILESFLDRVTARSGLRTELVSNVSNRLPLLQEREFWRIAQEAITNVERHALASQVEVHWTSKGESAELLVIDDGVGYPSDAGRLDSYGIIGMRERAASIGATLEIVGVDGEGTTLRCSVNPTSAVTT